MSVRPTVVPSQPRNSDLGSHGILADAQEGLRISIGAQSAPYEKKAVHEAHPSVDIVFWWCITLHQHKRIKPFCFSLWDSSEFDPCLCRKLQVFTAAKHRFIP
jgi:hypothetical protein